MKNIQELPEEKRRMIFWVIMFIIAFVLLIIWAIFDASPRVQRIMNTDLGSEFNLNKAQQTQTIDQAVEQRKEKIQESLREMIAEQASSSNQTGSATNTFTLQDEIEVVKMLQEMAGVTSTATNTPTTTKNNSTNTTSTSIFK